MNDPARIDITIWPEAGDVAVHTHTDEEGDTPPVRLPISQTTAEFLVHDSVYGTLVGSVPQPNGKFAVCLVEIPTQGDVVLAALQAVADFDDVGLDPKDATWKFLPRCHGSTAALLIDGYDEIHRRPVTAF